ncbi:hypothetical protein PFDG_04904 [Plasmodium falciparum Dd2]|uniref:Uncharacterized protein n=1 Tax=Plasmodium falciparum (isolate Dd2) TaxID=57267 RepID=A0A0L7M9V3_PLAF4|nr:hypothetical protein PFDG_04904 [Plasmodium falciparum Dd2]
MKNKYVQTSHSFLDDDFFFYNPKDIQDNINHDNDLRILKKKIRDYSKDLYHTLILCENCKGFYVDMFLIKYIQ